jgi:NDP-sugar pyrophosphorylase family protein
MQCVILAGGLGTRMKSVEARKPKTLLDVAGKPFAAWQLEWLASHGVNEIVYCIGHLGEQIIDFVGDGSYWNLNVTYVDEGPNLLGTAGALKLAEENGKLRHDFFVLYGDSYLQIESLSGIRHEGLNSGFPALMTVFLNRNKWDESNVHFSNGKIIEYNKLETRDRSKFTYIDYGLTWLEREVIANELETGTHSDLSSLMRKLSLEGRLAGVPVKDRFFEIGSPEGYVELVSMLRERD